MFGYWWLLVMERCWDFLQSPAVTGFWCSSIIRTALVSPSEGKAGKYWDGYALPYRIYEYIYIICSWSNMLFSHECYVYLLIYLSIYMPLYAHNLYIYIHIYVYIIFPICACIKDWLTWYQQFGVFKNPAKQLQETAGHSTAGQAPGKRTHRTAKKTKKPKVSKWWKVKCLKVFFVMWFCLVFFG